MTDNKAHHGFTLVELMVTIVVLAIVISFAVPSFQRLVASNNVTFDRDELYSLLLFARSEALKTGQSVTICKSSDGASCDNSLDWAASWLVFADANRDGVRAGSEKILRLTSAVDGGVTVNHSTGADVITFESRGLILAGAGDFTFAHPSESSLDKKVSLTVTGRASKGE